MTTQEHIHQFGPWSSWDKVGFDLFHRQRTCTVPNCLMVEDDQTNNPRVAGFALPSGGPETEEDDEAAYNNAIEQAEKSRPSVAQPNRQMALIPPPPQAEPVKPFSTHIDPYVEGVRTKLLLRSMVGIKKYGTTLERGDLTTLDWLNHAQEEAMDFCNYLERLIQDEMRRMAGEGG